jgi:hypothetical protein
MRGKILLECKKVFFWVINCKARECRIERGKIRKRLIERVTREHILDPMSQVR